MEVDSSTGTAESIVVVVSPSVNVGLFILFLVDRLLNSCIFRISCPATIPPVCTPHICVDHDTSLETTKRHK